MKLPKPTAEEAAAFAAFQSAMQSYYERFSEQNPGQRLSISLYNFGRTDYISTPCKYRSDPRWTVKTSGREGEGSTLEIALEKCAAETALETETRLLQKLRQRTKEQVEKVRKMKEGERLL